MFSRHKKGWVPSKQDYNEKHGEQEQNQSVGTWALLCDHYNGLSPLDNSLPWIQVVPFPCGYQQGNSLDPAVCNWEPKGKQLPNKAEETSGAE